MNLLAARARAHTRSKDRANMIPIVNMALRRLSEDPSWAYMTAAEKRGAAGEVLADLGSADPLDVFETIAAMDAKVDPKVLGSKAVAVDSEKPPRRAMRPKAGAPKKAQRRNTRKQLKAGPSLVTGPIDPYTQDSYLRRVKVCTGMTDDEIAAVIGKSRWTVVHAIQGSRREYLDKAAVEKLHRMLGKYADGITALMADLEERLRVATD